MQCYPEQIALPPRCHMTQCCLHEDWALYTSQTSCPLPSGKYKSILLTTTSLPWNTIKLLAIKNKCDISLYEKQNYIVVSHENMSILSGQQQWSRINHAMDNGEAKINGSSLHSYKMNYRLYYPLDRYKLCNSALSFL